VKLAKINLTLTFLDKNHLTSALALTSVNYLK